MKHIIHFFSLSVLSLILIACGESSTSEQSNQDVPTQTHAPIFTETFEQTDNLNNWVISNATDASITTNESIEGENSAYMTTPGESSPFISISMHNVTPVESGKYYEVSFYTKLKNGGFSNYWDFYVLVTQDSSATTLLDHGFNSSLSPIDIDWFQQKYYFKALSDTPISLSFNSAADETFIDNILIREVISDSQTTPPLSIDFESTTDIDFLNALPQNSTSITSDLAYSGTQSLYLSTPTSLESVDGIYLEANQTYEISFAARLAGDAFINYWDFEIEIRRGSSSVFSNGFNGSGQPISMDWLSKSILYTPIESGPVKFHVINRASEAWFDRLVIKPL